MHTTDPSHRPQALIVDDDLAARMLERETLEQSGFTVHEAADGESALDMLEALTPDLILLDVDMPGIDGFEVCRRIRQRWSPHDLPVIMVTGMDDLNSINLAYDVGANDFIPKPINWPVLGHRTRYVLRTAENARVLKELEEKQAAIVRAIPDMVFSVGRDGTFLDVKTGVGTLATRRPELYVGRRLSDVLPREVGTELHDGVRNALDSGTLQSVEYTLPGSAHARHYEARIAPSGTDKVIAVVRDITRQKLNEEKIRRLAYYDPLTGMPNRQHFLERLDQELERCTRDKRQLALLFLDLDGFKRINDTLGHDAGDMLLKQVATRLKEKLRVSDLVSRPGSEAVSPHLARLGGDEFVIVLPSLQDSGAATTVARRVRCALTRPFPIADAEVTVGSSIGIAMFPADGKDAATLLKHADTAMYHAKDLGRNNWQMYNQALTDQAMNRLKLENELRKALEQNEFVLFYQPLVDVEDKRMVGVEALLRWQHPRRGLIAPAEFIHVAEDSGLIVPLGIWLLRTACAQAQAWQNKELKAGRIGVNLSARQVRTPGFAAEVADAIAQTGIAPYMLELELTENLLIDTDPAQLEDLQRIRDSGVHFALDDFGTGYSSLSYLKRLPIETLKIDRSFVSGVPHKADDVAITTAIVAMARSLGLEVVAEGVETAAQRDFLHHIGCRKMQGYLFSPPLPAAQMERLLRQAATPTP